ncbi:hypothetical protein ONE63_000015 [Megalurothrips usitatus]|uniref:RNA-directed DNA polymerase n=1 Tax=Megalurothrips usitatus TaxID=439358 RepID=A0AAV7Y4C3_9NEOP|nr:hypothetical protein ONE63_000015 [Megalurothrips usitatus]
MDSANPTKPQILLPVYKNGENVENFLDSLRYRLEKLRCTEWEIGVYLEDAVRGSDLEKLVQPLCRTYSISSDGESTCSDSSSSTDSTCSNFSESTDGASTRKKSDYEYERPKQPAKHSRLIAMVHDDYLTASHPVLKSGNKNDSIAMVSLITIRLNNASQEALVDTGAVSNVIDIKVLNEIFPCAKIQKGSLNLRTANNQRMKTYGSWIGDLQIGNLFFRTKFFVVKELSQRIILGNAFLRKAQALIDYKNMTITLRNSTQKVSVQFGVFFKSTENMENIDNIFEGMKVEELYSGPRFVRSKNDIVIPPKTVKYVQVSITPHLHKEDTVFVGNPNLFKHYKLMVSDFILTTKGKKFIQITNSGTVPKIVNTTLNLAVDDSHEDLFYNTINSISHSTKEEKFNINPDLSPHQATVAKALLEKYKDLFASDVSELTKCSYPPILFGYDKSKIVRQRNYRMSPDEKAFAEEYIQKLLDADLVERCTSVYCTPILVVPKASTDPNQRAYRLVQDFRKINKILTDIRYPIPDQQELLDSFFEYFDLLRENQVQLNFKKSTFFQREVKFLGVIVNGKEVKVSEKRIRSITGMDPPKDKDELRKKLGVFGYNRKFIENYAKRSEPLQKLLRQNVEFEWGEEQTKAFNNLKSALTNPPALRLFNPHANNRITVDASYQGLGVAYYQFDSTTNKYHPVAFASRKLKGTESKLPVYYLECAALVFAFVTFRCYLQNRSVKTEVLTDHQSLQSLLKTPKPEGVIAKYIMYLSQFNFSIRYRTGKSNVDADSLSRSPVDIPEKTVEELVDEDWPDMVKINAITRAQAAQQKLQQQEAKELDKENALHVYKSMDILTKDPNYLEYLQSKDEFISKIKKNLSDMDHADHRMYIVKDKIVYKINKDKPLVVVPQECRKYILLEFHDRRGHRALKHLVKNISEFMWWPSLTSDCSIYVRSCKYCMLHKENKLQKPGFLKPVIAKRPFSQIACDFVGKLPLTKKKNQHFCIIVDYYTKYMWTRAVKEADTENAIDCLSSFSKQYGLCEAYTSDSASYFTSFAFQQLLDKWNIFHNAFRQIPHCNGQVERSVQSLKNILAQLLIECGEEWDKYLEIATLIYNINYHETIKCSPFFALHGFNPNIPGISQLLPQSSEALEEKLQKHLALLKNLRLRIQKSQEKVKQYYDRKRHAVTYRVGQYVRVKNENSELGWPQKKILWRGPFKIVGRKSDRFYFVLRSQRTPSGKKKQIVKEYHVQNIRPYVKRPKYLRLNNLESVSAVCSHERHCNLQQYTPRCVSHMTGNVLNAPLQYKIAFGISADCKMKQNTAERIHKYFKIKHKLLHRNCDLGTAEHVSSHGRDFYSLIVTEKHYDKPSYADLKDSLRDMKRQMVRYKEKCLAISELTSDLKGSHMHKIIDIILTVFADTDIDIVMYHGDTSDEMITSFQDELAFLSNDYTCSVEIDGEIFNSVDHAYNANKFLDPSDKEFIREASSPELARERALLKQNHIRPDWMKIRDDWMARCVHEKFQQNKIFSLLLQLTGNRFILDRYDGNILGVILMKERQKALQGRKDFANRQ